MKYLTKVLIVLCVIFWSVLIYMFYKNGLLRQDIVTLQTTITQYETSQAENLLTIKRLVDDREDLQNRLEKFYKTKQLIDAENKTLREKVSKPTSKEITNWSDTKLPKDLL